MSQATTGRVEKRYLTMKEEFMKKVRNFSSGGKREKRKVEVLNLDN